MSAGDLWDLPKGNGMIASQKVFLLQLLLHLEKKGGKKSMSQIETRGQYNNTHEDQERVAKIFICGITILDT